MLKNLNPQQLAAVKHFGSPLLIVAGAGSGKTKFLTHKIAYIIDQKLTAPQHILAITFTNKAASEMKNRVQELLGEQCTEFPFISTFHSFCAYVLRKDFQSLNRPNNFIIYDSYEQQKLIKNILKNMDISKTSYTYNFVLAKISEFKNKLISYQDYATLPSNHILYDQVLAQIYEKYQQGLISNNAIDFDDMLFYTVVLFQRNPLVLAKYQTQFKYLLIDEYQDTNHAQYNLAKLLASQHQNIYVVGDFDQNIYSWRGANVQNILNFEKDYAQAKVLYLEQNYRSTKTILKAANGLIKHNQQRKEKKLWTENAEGEPLVFYKTKDEKQEAEYIAQKILSLKEKSEYQDIAVLYRTNAQSRVLEEILASQKIPYKLVGGFSFYSRSEVKDIMAYLRLIYNQADNQAFIRALSKPSRGVGQTSITKLLNQSQATNLSIYELIKQNKTNLATKQTQSLKSFATLIFELEQYYQTLTEDKIGKLVKSLLKKSGYQQMLEIENTPISLDRLENIKEIISITKNENLELGDFLNNIALISDIDNTVNLDNAVTLMTMHNAKGLEYKIVFIAGMEEGLLPHYRSKNIPEALEEERRLCYVSLTRAKEQLFLTAVDDRLIFGELWKRPTSCFLDEIPQDTLLIMEEEKSYSGHPHSIVYKSKEKFKNNQAFDHDFNVGDKVKHKIWGEGIIHNLEGIAEKSIAHIRFNGESKKLMLKYAAVTKV
ncbi:UvrD-helicase domain-containing protein [bacterium]|nr:UvrD-helicase domain-containing protein [bacterium]